MIIVQILQDLTLKNASSLGIRGFDTAENGPQPLFSPVFGRRSGAGASISGARRTARRAGAATRRGENASPYPKHGHRRTSVARTLIGEFAHGLGGLLGAPSSSPSNASWALRSRAAAVRPARQPSKAPRSHLRSPPPSERARYGKCHAYESTMMQSVN